MNISFYQVPVGFNPNFTYLGDLEEKHSEDVNVDLKLLEYVDIPLYSSNTKYNYVKITNGDLKYYYSLYSIEYMNFNQNKIKYKLDVIRTLKESTGLNYEILTAQFSEIMDMGKEQMNYFIRNQPVKLSANVLNGRYSMGIKYSNHALTNQYWRNMKWIYVWLQPKETIKLDSGRGYLYSIKETFREEPAGIVYDYRPPTGSSTYNTMNPSAGWVPAWGTQAYPGRIWIAKLPGSEDYEYYKATETRVNQLRIRTYVAIDSPLTDVVRTNYVGDLPEVKNADLVNNLYCLVFPNTDVILNGPSNYGTVWSSDLLFKNVFNVNQEDNWLPYIVDIKISDMPPFDKIGEYINNSTQEVPYQITPNLSFFDHMQGTNFREVSGTTSPGVHRNPLWGIRSKIDKPLEMTIEGFVIPDDVTSDLIKEKYYLSVFENRVELDMALLINDKATKLWFYEDIQPGRTNYILGFAPDGSDEEVLHYLAHSPSTLNLSRDNTLPVFTSNYQEYIASNKNFIAQAELTRNTQLINALINNGSNAVGAAATGVTVDNFNPALAVVGAAGGVANALINKNAQEKQFNWMVDNIKTAPGSYKNANATTSLLLTLGMIKPWIGKYDSNQFDVNLYFDLINNLGYSYFNFPYNLNDLVNKIEQVGTGKRKFLQGTITGITYSESSDAYLIHLLHKYLTEGVNVYT